MITETIPQFQRSHDPDDLVPRNVGIGRILRDWQAVYDHADVTLDPSNTDHSLEITSVAYSSSLQRIGFLINGGVRDAQAADPNTGIVENGYLIHLRIWFTNGLHCDRSVWQRVRQH